MLDFQKFNLLIISRVKMIRGLMENLIFLI